MQVAIFHNSKKRNADNCALRVADILHDCGIEVFSGYDRKDFYTFKPFMHFGDFGTIAKSCDVVIAIGGDGTILNCAKHIVGSNTKLLGINTGRLGFMASVEPSELNELRRLVEGSYSVLPHMMLNVSLSTGETFEALNDISIFRQFSRIFDFSIRFDNSNISVGSYRADGIVFSTPTGSTAYSLSAGGPIIEPDAECIEMVLLAPHSLGTRPMIFSPERSLVFSHSCKEEDIFFSVDGSNPVSIDCGTKITIKKSKYYINIIDMMGNTFYNSLDKKLNVFK